MRNDAHPLPHHAGCFGSHRASRADGRGAQKAPCGIRAHDLPLTERVLYQLS